MLCNVVDGEPRIFNDRSSQLEKYVADGNEVVEFKLGNLRSIYACLLNVSFYLLRQWLINSGLFNLCIV